MRRSSPFRDLPFHRLLLLTGRPREHLAACLAVSPRTLDGYARGRPAPAAVRLVLEVLAGWMPWAGFERCTVAQGAIYVDCLVDGVTPAELAVIHWTRQRADMLAREVARLKAAPAQYLLDWDRRAAG
jgi:hypothetical protein